jgi:tetratricopeptide (TPR) repeat protein
VFHVAIEDEHGTHSVDEQPPEVRTRRAAVLAGIGLVWAAFMASIGLVLAALLILVAAAAGAAWILGMRTPRVDLRSAADRARALAATATGRARQTSRRFAVRARAIGVAAARASRAHSGRLVAASRHRGTSAFRHLAAGGRRVFATASHARQSAQLPRITLPRLNRRPDPRIEEALASNSEGIALAKAGRHVEAIDAFDTALALLAETDDRHHEGQVLANLGTVHRKVGGTEAARFCWTRALERLEPGTPESERTAELLGVR